MAVATGIMTNFHPAAGALFAQALQGLADILRKVFLPHLAAGLGLFIISVYSIYSFILALAHLPPPAEVILVGALFLGYGLAAFAYSFITACAFALRIACATWEEFIDNTLDQVKQAAAHKINDMNESLAKDQAKVIISGSVREVFGEFNQGRKTSFGRALTRLLLGVTSLAMRSVLLSRLVKISGQTVQLGKLFAGRATLVGAIFLNLRLFSTLLLIFLYILGIVALILNFLLVFWLK